MQRDPDAAGRSPVRLPGRARRVRPAQVAATLAVLAIVAATAAGLARVRLDTTVASFLPAGDPAVRTLNAEQSSFGADPIAILLTSKQPAGLLSGQALRDEIGLESKLSSLPDVAVVYGPGTTLNEISRSLQQVLVDISGRRDGLMAQAEQAAKAAGKSPAQQTAAGAAAVAGFDRRYGSLLVQGLRIGLPTIGNANLGRSVFFGAGGQPQPAFRWLVPDATHESILVRPVPGLDQARTEALVAAVRRAVAGAKLPVSQTVVTGSPVIVSALAREVTSELPLLAGASLAVVAAGFLLGRRHRPVWERLAPLGIGLAATAVTMAAFGWAGASLSLGLLAFLPIILGVGTDYPIYALRRGRPRLILATSAASAASLAVLALDPLPYVRDLGIALAAGLFASAAIGLGVARLLGPIPDTPGRPPRPARRMPGRRPLLVAGALAAALAALGWASLGSLGLNSDPERLASGLPALRQGVAAEKVLGASGELDVYVTAPDVLSPALVGWYRRAQDRLVADHGDQLRPVVSPASLLSWLGADPTPSQVTAATELLPSYLTAAAVRDDRKQAVMAFGVRLGSLDSEVKLISAIKADLPPLPPGASVSVTGLPAVGARSYVLLSGGNRLLPNLGGIAVFGVVLAALLADRRSAVLAVAAAALAAGWGFALLYLTGTPLTPLTVSLGSLTSAVGGEFTVMAMAYAPGRGGDRRGRGWAAVGAAAATSVTGFAVLSLSRLEVLRQFGIVLAGSVLLALVAAGLVVTLDGASRRDARAPGELSAAETQGVRQEALV